MKLNKLFCLILIAVASFFLISCDGGSNPSGGKGGKYIENLDELLEEGDTISISFYSIFGQAKSASLESQIAKFEQMMEDVYGVTVDVTHTSQSTYDTLYENVNTYINSDDDSNIPNIVLGYPDHFAEYLSSKRLLKLDGYINHPEYGVNLDDYIQTYMQENRQWKDKAGNYITYSLPFAKSCEFMIYNKTMIDAVNETLDAANKIEIPYNTPLTWSKLNSWTQYFVGTNGYKKTYTVGSTSTTVNPIKLVSYDSMGNLFINTMKQRGANYTSADGQLLIDQGNSSKTALTQLATYMKNNTLGIAKNFETTAEYCSTYFKQQKCVFNIGSTAGYSYCIVSSSDVDNKNIFEAFDVGFALVPQYSTSWNLTSSGTNSVIQQGPNICLLDTGTDAEKFVSWLFVKYMTYQNEYDPSNASADEDGFVPGRDNSALFALGSGYFPVTTKAYNSQIYQDLLAIAVKYYTQIGQDKSQLSAKELASLNSACVAYIGYLQSGYGAFDPAFSTVGNNKGSAALRVLAEDLIGQLGLNPNISVDSLITEMCNKARGNA